MMCNLKPPTMALLGVILLALVPLARADNPSLDALKQRFKARYPALRQLKDQGKVGETWDGWVDSVQAPEPTAKKLVDEENADRKALYVLIAKNEGATPDEVAKRNAARNFEHAHPGDYLKHEDGKWVKKS